MNVISHRKAKMVIRILKTETTVGDTPSAEVIYVAIVRAIVYVYEAMHVLLQNVILLNIGTIYIYIVCVCVCKHLLHRM